MTSASGRAAAPASIPANALGVAWRSTRRRDAAAALRALRPAPLALAAVVLVVAWAVIAAPPPRGARDPGAEVAAPSAEVAAQSAEVAAPAPAATASGSGAGVLFSDGPGPGTAAALDPIGLAGKTALVVALLYATLRGLRRLQAGAPARGAQLVVLESRPLAAKASVHLVALGDRRILVGLTQGSIAPLAELGPAWWDEAGAAGATAETPPAPDPATRFR